ncbi:MAG: amidase, partial [Actinomycetia bacterium]|nr:amidase [Actinomycetes bacterium]
MSELHDLTALEQAAAVRRREVSPVELAEHYLARIDRLADDLGAFITVTPELALEQARAAEDAVRRADDPADLPVLHGLPVPVKDLNFVAGVRCTLGSLTYDLVPFGDDNVVQALRAGSLAFTGKTNTPEFGLPCYTENAVAPPARTPWDRSRSAGGSSGGAAAAVAGGLAPVAHGSDGGGSVRIPASVCGLVGIKPSRGRISNGPLRDPVGDLVTNGPLARTVADAAALLDVMAGPFPGDPYVALPLPPGETFLDHATRDPGRLRIGRYRTPVIASTEVHPECVAAFEESSQLLADLGHEVVDVDPPFGPELVPMFEVLWSV